LNATLETEGARGLPDAELRNLLSASGEQRPRDLGNWWASQLLRLPVAGTSLAGEALAGDDFGGEESKYTGFENKTPLVGVSFHGFNEPLISVTFMDCLLGSASSSSASSDSLKLPVGELNSFCLSRFVPGLCGCGEFGDDELLQFALETLRLWGDPGPHLALLWESLGRDCFAGGVSLVALSEGKATLNLFTGFDGGALALMVFCTWALLGNAMSLLFPSLEFFFGSWIWSAAGSCLFCGPSWIASATSVAICFANSLAIKISEITSWTWLAGDDQCFQSAEGRTNQFNQLLKLFTSVSSDCSSIPIELTVLIHSTTETLMYQH
jgi:hypothetical protein